MEDIKAELERRVMQNKIQLAKAEEIYDKNTPNNRYGKRMQEALMRCNYLRGKIIAYEQALEMLEAVLV